MTADPRLSSAAALSDMLARQRMDKSKNRPSNAGRFRRPDRVKQACGGRSLVVVAVDPALFNRTACSFQDGSGMIIQLGGFGLSREFSFHAVQHQGRRRAASRFFTPAATLTRGSGKLFQRLAPGSPGVTTAW